MRLIFLGIFCLAIIFCPGFGQKDKPETEVGFADGHVHAGFAKKDGILATRFAYFQLQGVKTICLSLPLDSSRTADLRARISGEIAALRELANRERTFRLLPGDGGTPGPPGELDVFLSVEYFHGAFNGDAGLVNAYRDLGIRAVTLIDNDRDPFFAGGALTPFGKKVIALMDESGLRIDVSHLDSAQKLAVIAAAKSPVLVSHTNARSVADLDYNIPDEVLAALKKNRGSVLVSFNRNGVFAENGGRSGGIAQLADHIDHFVEWLGVDHVGIGSDYQADGRYVAAPLNEPDAFGRIARELAGRGHDAAAIHQIMSANVRRLFGAGEKAYNSE